MAPGKYALLAGALALTLAAWRAPLPAAAASYGALVRIVAVGDVHGDLPGLRTILKEAGIIDAQGNWAGGTSTFVQTGDLLDRGPDDKAVLDFMIDLQKKAQQAGGRVISLLGNHEVMNMMGDWRYVSSQSYAPFIDNKSEKRRQELLKDTVKYLKRRAKSLQQEEPDLSEAWQAQWMEDHPLGYVERRQAFDRQGTYGKWLRRQPAIAQLGGYVFLHGGISTLFSELSIKELNKRIQNELKVFDSYRKHLDSLGIILDSFTLEEFDRAVRAELDLQTDQPDLRPFMVGNDMAAARARHRQHVEFLQGVLGYGSWFSMHPAGPLWFRGYAEWEDEEGALLIQEIAQAYQASAFIVGHTPQLEGGIQTRFEGRVVLIDTGLHIEFYPGGIPSALEISDGQFTAIYPDRQQTLLAPQALAAVQGQ
ncbi:MAG: metallophosphoesterase [Acidobacteriota bacterium]